MGWVVGQASLQLHGNSSRQLHCKERSHLPLFEEMRFILSYIEQGMTSFL